MTRKLTALQQPKEERKPVRSGYCQLRQNVMNILTLLIYQFWFHWMQYNMTRKRMMQGFANLYFLNPIPTKRFFIVHHHPHNITQWGRYYGFLSWQVISASRIQLYQVTEWHILNKLPLEPIKQPFSGTRQLGHVKEMAV